MRIRKPTVEDVQKMDLRGGLDRADERLRAGLNDAGDRHPTLRRAYRWACSHRILVLSLGASARGVLDGLGYMYTQDLKYFAAAATELFSGDWANSFTIRGCRSAPSS